MDRRLQDEDGTASLRGRRVLSWRRWETFGAGAYDRGEGEGTWQSDQHRLVLCLTPMPPLLLQIDGGPPQRIASSSGSVSFYPAGHVIRTSGSDSRYAHVCWDPGLYGTIAPDLTPFAHVEPALAVPDPLLGQLLVSLVEEVGGSRLDRLLADSRWRDGGARMDLVQQGNRVTGAYPVYGGRIEGTVVGSCAAAGPRVRARANSASCWHRTDAASWTVSIPANGGPAPTC